MAVDIGTWQVWATAKFEVLKYKKKIIGLFLMTIAVAVFVSFGMYYLSWRNYDMEIPAIPTLMQVISNSKLLITIIATILASGIIVADIEKKTTMVFPNISKSRLYYGRIFALYGMLALMISAYYGIIWAFFIDVFPNESIPVEFFYSWGLALMYGAMLFSVILLLSAIFKKESTVNILGLSLLAVILPLVSLMGQMFGLLPDLEPFYDPGYIFNIITYSIYMPSERVFTRETGLTINGEQQVLTQWITPSLSSALITMSLVILIALSLAYRIFKKKQI